MPQFDLANFAPQLAWLALFFAILYFGIVRTTLPRLGGLIQLREDKVKGDLDAAHHAKSEADGTRALYETAMVNARHEAQATVARSKAEVGRTVEAQLKQADHEIEARLVSVTAALADQRVAAEGHIAQVASGAAADIVAQLTGERPEEAEATGAVGAAMAA